MTKQSMSQIRQANLEAGQHHFDRSTMRFFGETMRNYTAGKVIGENSQVVYRNGGRAGRATFVFDNLTGRMVKQQEYSSAANIALRTIS